MEINKLEETELIEIIKESREAKGKIQEFYFRPLINFLKEVKDEEKCEEIARRVLESALQNSPSRPYFCSFDVWILGWLQDHLLGEKLPKNKFFSVFESLDFKDEKKLLDTYQKGEEASAVLYKRYAKFVASKIIKTGVGTKDLEDLSQEIFQIAFSNISNLRNPGSFKNWLGAISSHYASRYRKNTEKIVEYSLETLQENSFNKMDEKLFNENNPLIRTLKREEINSLKNELDKLQEKYKKAIYLKYFKDMDYDEISGILGLEIKTVYKRVFYGLQKLREALKGS